eukprot:COSAG05_NODE_4125_length_1662_cov_1.078055_2_plen_323_part_01
MQGRARYVCVHHDSGLQVLLPRAVVIGESEGGGPGYAYRTPMQHEFTAPLLGDWDNLPDRDEILEELREVPKAGTTTAKDAIKQGFEAEAILSHLGWWRYPASRDGWWICMREVGPAGQKSQHLEVLVNSALGLSADSEDGGSGSSPRPNHSSVLETRAGSPSRGTMHPRTPQAPRTPSPVGFRLSISSGGGALATSTGGGTNWISAIPVSDLRTDALLSLFPPSLPDSTTTGLLLLSLRMAPEALLLTWHPLPYGTLRSACMCSAIRSDVVQMPVCECHAATNPTVRSSSLSLSLSLPPPPPPPPPPLFPPFLPPPPPLPLF